MDVYMKMVYSGITGGVSGQIGQIGRPKVFISGHFVFYGQLSKWQSYNILIFIKLKLFYCRMRKIGNVHQIVS